MKNTIVIILIASLGFGLVGCTRKTEETTKVTFAIPSLAGLRKGVSQDMTTAPDHTIINVKGSDLGSGIICHFELKRLQAEGPCDFSAYPSVSVTVPTSDKVRLFQVGMLNETTTGMELFYGENNATVSGATADVPIKMNLVDVSGGQTGHMRGQYLIGSAGGPTGKLEVRLKPQTGTITASDSITLMTSEMYNGWFQAVSFEVLPLEYYINGVLMFGKPMSKADFVALAAANPAAIRVTSGSNGYEMTGFYGAAADVGSRFTNNDAGCTQALEFVQCLKGTSDFNGPFRRDSSGNLFSISGATGSWQFVPGSAALFEGVNVYFIQTATQEIKDRVRLSYGEYDCEYLRANPAIATFVGTVPTPSTSVTIAGVTPTADSVAVACPVMGGRQMVSGVTYPSIETQSGGNCTTCQYLRLEITGSAHRNSGSFNYVTTVGQCYPVSVSVYQGQGTSVNATGVITLTGLSGTTNGTFYNDSSCSSSPFTGGTAVAIPSGQHTSPMFYFKPTTIGMDITVVMQSSDPAVTFNGSYNLFDVEQPILSADVPANIAVGVCYPILLGTYQAPGDDLTLYNYTSRSMTLAFNFSVNNGNLYSNPSCTTSLGASGASSFTTLGATFLYYKASSTTPSPVTLGFTATGYVPSSEMMNVKQGADVPDHVTFDFYWMPLQAGQCIPVDAVLVNWDGAEVPAKSNFNYKLSLPGNIGKIYGDGNCTNLTDYVMFNVPQSRASFFVKFFVDNVTAAANIRFENLGGGFPADNTPIVVDPNPTGAGADYIYLQLPSFGKAEIIGDHEFTDLSNTAKLIPIVAPAGSTFECSEDDMNWGPCGSNVQGNNFVWTVARATAAMASDQDFFIRRVGSYSYDHVRFSPQSIWGNNFRVMHCNYIQTTSAAFADLITNFASNPVICLAPGISINKSANYQQYTLSNGQSIIGSAAGTSEINYVSYAGGTFSVNSGPVSSTFHAIANLRFINVAGSSPYSNSADTAAIDLSGINPGSNNVNVVVSGNQFVLSRWAAGVRIFTHSSPNVNITIRKNDFQLVNTYESSQEVGGVGVWIQNQTVGTINFQKNTASGSSGVNSSASVGIWQQATAVNSIGTNVEDFVAGGVLNGVKIEGTGATYSVNQVAVTNSRFELANGPGSATNIALKLDSVSNFNVSGNLFRAAGTSDFGQLVYIGNYTTGSFVGNVLENDRPGNPGALNRVMGIYGANIGRFTDNHFVDRSGSLYAATTPMRINGGYMMAVNMGATPTIPVHGNNLYCSDSGSIWTNVIENTFTNGNASSDAWSSSLTDSKCRYANDVSALGLCKTPCAP